MSVSELKKEAKRIIRESDTPPPPEGQYRVLYADPPWDYDDQRTGGVGSGAALANYETMPTECIAALHTNGRSVKDIAGKDSVLFLWTTAPTLPDALQVISAWGFKYRAQFVWNKVRSYNGHYNDVQHELLLIAVRGGCQPENDSLHGSIVTVERTGHSKKPEEFYDIIEEMYPSGPYLELFARNTRGGWKSWGNEL